MSIIFNPEPNRIFEETSIFNRGIIKDPVYAPDSEQRVARMCSLIREKPITLGRNQSGGVPIYTIPSPGHSDSVLPVPVTMVHPEWDRVMAARFAQGVPIPLGAIPQTKNHDNNLVIVQLGDDGLPDTLIEIFQAQFTLGKWYMGQGGIKEHVPHAPARYVHVEDGQGNILSLPNWGVSASGLSVHGGVMLQQELRDQYIPHALQFLTWRALKGQWAYPAQRCDGNDDDPLAMPEGAHMQLDPTKDYSNLPFPLDLMCLASQEFGVVLMDKTSGSSWRCQTPLSAGFDALAAVPQEISAHYPYEDLRLLPMSMRTKHDTTRYRWDDATQHYVEM